MGKKVSNATNNKRRGFGFERELVNEARAAGLSAKRAWGSNGQSLGCDESVDALIAGYRVQAKRRKRLAGYLQIPDGCDVVAIREDRGQPLILLPYARFLELISD